MVTCNSQLPRPDPRGHAWWWGAWGALTAHAHTACPPHGAPTRLTWSLALW